MVDLSLPFAPGRPRASRLLQEGTEPPSAYQLSIDSARVITAPDRLASLPFPRRRLGGEGPSRLWQQNLEGRSLGAGARTVATHLPRPSLGMAVGKEVALRSNGPGRVPSSKGTRTSWPARSFRALRTPPHFLLCIFFCSPRLFVFDDLCLSQFSFLLRCSGRPVSEVQVAQGDRCWHVNSARAAASSFRHRRTRSPSLPCEPSLPTTARPTPPTIYRSANPLECPPTYPTRRMPKSRFRARSSTSSSGSLRRSRRTATSRSRCGVLRLWRRPHLLLSREVRQKPWPRKY
jgi:hypothetical protein